MKNKTSLMLSIVSLAMTFFSLVFCTFAWFTTKVEDEVTLTYIKAVSSKIESATLTKYVAKFDRDDEANSKYENGLEVTSSTTLLPYDDVFDYDKVIYQFDIVAREKVSIDLFLCLTNAKENNEDNDKVIEKNDKCYNYISNVGKFTYIESSTNKLSGDSIRFDYTVYSTDKKTMKEIELPQGTTSLRFLFDYDKDNVNSLYTANLGITSNIFFLNDFEFLISEVE